MSDNKLNIQITAEDKASQVINVIGTAFESAATDIASMVAKADLAKIALDVMASSEKAVAVGLDAMKKAIAAADDSIKRLADDGKSSTDRLSKSFASLNIKTALDIEKEKQRLVSAFLQIKNSGVASAMEVAQAQNSLRSKMKELDEQANNTGSAMRRLDESNKSGAASSKSMFDIVGSLALRFNSIVDTVKMAGNALMSLAEPALIMDKLTLTMQRLPACRGYLMLHTMRGQKLKRSRSRPLIIWSR